MKDSNLTLIAAALLSVATPYAAPRAAEVEVAQQEQQRYETEQEEYLARVQHFAKLMDAAQTFDELPEGIRNEFNEEETTRWRDTILKLTDNDMSDKLFGELITIARSNDNTQSVGAIKILAFAASFDRLSRERTADIFNLAKNSTGKVGQGAGWTLFHIFMHRMPTADELNKLADLACLPGLAGEGPDGILHTLAIDGRLSADHFDLLMRVATSDTTHWRSSLGVVELVKHDQLDRSHLPALLEGAKQISINGNNLGLAVGLLVHKVTFLDEDVPGIIDAATSMGEGAQFVLHALVAMAKKSERALEGLIAIAGNDRPACARPALFLLHKLIEDNPNNVPEKYMNDIDAAIAKHKDGEKVWFQITPQQIVKV